MAMTKEQAALELLRKIARSNVIATDLADCRAREVVQDFPQDESGRAMRIEFTISHHALGKVRDAGELLEVLDVTRRGGGLT